MLTDDEITASVEFPHGEKSSQMTWHVALVMGGNERKALFRLTAGSVGALWPRWTDRIKSLSGAVREVDRPLASGYVLVEFDGFDAHAWHRTRDLSGAYGFIGGERPTSVSQTAMERLFDRCLTSDGLMERPDQSGSVGLLKTGDVVTCRFDDDSMFWPWTGQTASVKWDDNRGVSVSLTMMGRETQLYVPYPEALGLELSRVKPNRFTLMHLGRQARQLVTA